VQKQRAFELGVVLVAAWERLVVAAIKVKRHVLVDTTKWVSRAARCPFNAALARVTQELRVADLEKVPGEVIDLISLRDVDLIGSGIKAVKIFGEGKLTRKFVVRGLRVSKSAKLAIESAGGLVE